jgi:hypothetical protein
VKVATWVTIERALPCGPSHDDCTADHGTEEFELFVSAEVFWDKEPVGSKFRVVDDVNVEQGALSWDDLSTKEQERIDDALVEEHARLERAIVEKRQAESEDAAHSWRKSLAEERDAS